MGRTAYTSKGQPADTVGHSMGSGARTLYGENRYALRYWHASGDHPPHDTENGRSPLKRAFQAATKIGDGVPR